MEILNAFALRILPRRAGADFEDLKPRERDAAPRGSMSSITGTGAQPMHTDGAYLPQPPSHIALWCLDPGEAHCPTHLWPIDTTRLRRDRPNTLTAPVWVAQGGGHAPFYCSLFDATGSRVRVRFDPFCIRPASGSNLALDAAKTLLSAYCTGRVDVSWTRYSMLIIDNWRCLHARGSGGDFSPSRCLRRWSLGVDNGLVVRRSLQ